MKNYPKIKRLSTLGIRHHQSFDYEFNAFRTDFVGEGGSGKSMIADMLQLIFVGPSAFHSPTKSTGPRKPKTMVLKSKNEGTDCGYAFINIEVEKDKFIIIGIYLESTGTSHMFIIQDGTDFEEDAKLIPFSSLLSYSDFLQENNILPIEYLKDHISDSLNLTCESWQKTTNYHKLLCNDKNTIIPVDISKNHKALENYSKIIQAFSRESLDIKKSDKIQSFLFGNDKEKKFYDDFTKAVNELNGDVKLFESNAFEIKKLKDRQLQLQELLKKKHERDNNKEQLFYIEYNYQKLLNSNSKKEIIKAFKSYDKSIKSLIFLEKHASQKLLETSSLIKSIFKEYDTVYKTKTEWETKINKLKIFKRWLEEFNCSKDDIIIKYQNYHKSKDFIKKINDLKRALKVENILAFFETKEVWPTRILVEIETQLSRLKELLTIKKKLKALHNINDSKSLAYWALNLKRELNIDEESIIHKYQNEGVRIEEPSKIEKRYIPKPNLLINNINITKKTDIGFWLNLNGISEFVQYVAEPLFNNDTDSIRQYFTNQSDTLLIDINKLNTEINNYEILKRIFEKTENLEKHIIAWNSRNRIEELESHILFDASEGDIKEYSSLFSLNDKIDKNYREAIKKFNKIDSKRSSLKTLEDNLEKELEAFQLPNFDFEIDPYKKENDYLKNESIIVDDFLSQLNDSEDYYREFIKLKDIEFKRSNQLETIQKLNLVITESDKRTIEIIDDFKVFFNKEFEKNDKVQIVDKKELEDLKKDSKVFEDKYLFKYNSLVRDFLESKKERYENTGDFIGLCKEILPPEIFDEEDLLNENLVSNINKRLREINEKNRKLNGRKLQKLSAIIDEVNTEVSEQLDYFRKIKNFLNTEDKTITGGHRANLSKTFNNAFPREWMSKFTEDIDNDLALSIDNSLFDPLKGITNKLEEFTSLKEKMIEAFYRCGGSKSIKPTIEDLLNPKSYYDLKFSIKSIQTKNSNDGSTSQTYAAIALLCIARLSLIERNSFNGKLKKGIRFMPIDEAEGLGSNFDMLYDIAKANNYQLLSLSIQPNKVDAKNQNIYLLHNNLEEEDNVNYEPIPIFGSQNEVEI